MTKKDDDEGIIKIPNRFKAISDYLDYGLAVQQRHVASFDDPLVPEANHLAIVLGEHLRRMVRVLAHDHEKALMAIRGAQYTLNVLLQELSEIAKMLLEMPRTEPIGELLMLHQHATVAIELLATEKEPLPKETSDKLAVVSERLAQLARMLREEAEKQAKTLEHFAWELKP